MQTDLMAQRSGTGIVPFVEQLFKVTGMPDAITDCSSTDTTPDFVLLLHPFSFGLVFSSILIYLHTF